MAVLACEIECLIHDSFSLKDKRQTVKSIIQRMQSRYKVAIAEVDDLDLHNKTRIEFAYVSNNRTLARTILEKVYDEIELNYNIEILNAEWLEL